MAALAGWLCPRWPSAAPRPVPGAEKPFLFLFVGCFLDVCCIFWNVFLFGILGLFFVSFVFKMSFIFLKWHEVMEIIVSYGFLMFLGLFL